MSPGSTENLNAMDTIQPQCEEAIWWQLRTKYSDLDFTTQQIKAGRLWFMQCASNSVI